ncbi:uncharacterized protein LOC135701855 [Ochlerotatus camptorhynchus]|uniref:uncharacterized protein LOC135701855 n=1 Tax=Ochlerotatus camptorhynchus TaxID=644619 RepID=UPI0031D8FDDC
MRLAKADSRQPPGLLFFTAQHKFDVPEEQAKYSFVADQITECDNGLPFVSIDFSNFEIINQDDGTLFYNGSLTMLKDFNSPWRIKITSKRLERGTWQPGIIAKEIFDLCKIIGNPLEPGIYKVTQMLDKKACPFNAGHSEQFDMVNVGTYGLNLPPSFAGDWKFYVEIWTVRRGTIDHECYIFPATVYEV